MKKLKLCLILSALLICSLSITVSANETSSNLAAYQEKMNCINQEYNVDLVFFDVDTEKVTLEQFETYMREVAADERAVLDYLESIEPMMEKDISENSEMMPRQIIIVHQSKDVSYACGIICEFSYPHDSNKVTYIGSTLAMYTDAIASGGQLNGITKISHAYLNNQTVIGVRYNANVTVSYISYGNKTFYAEFSK